MVIAFTWGLMQGKVCYVLFFHHQVLWLYIIKRIEHISICNITELISLKSTYIFHHSRCISSAQEKSTKNSKSKLRQYWTFRFNPHPKIPMQFYQYIKSLDFKGNFSRIVNDYIELEKVPSHQFKKINLCTLRSLYYALNLLFFIPFVKSFFSSS